MRCWQSHEGCEWRAPLAHSTNSSTAEQHTGIISFFAFLYCASFTPLYAASRLATMGARKSTKYSYPSAV